MCAQHATRCTPLIVTYSTATSLSLVAPDWVSNEPKNNKKNAERPQTREAANEKGR